MALDPYLVALVLVGVAVVGVSLLPRLLADHPLSIPIVFVALGAVAFSLPLDLPSPDPIVHGRLTERLTELGVILALMSAGLKLDRPPGLRRWGVTWRLLGITMPLTILAAALLGWGVLGLAIPAAALLGAVVAPTDPVLASSVQVPEPEPEEPPDEPEIQFALTSEAGLNDSLAFPFTYLAILLLTEGVAPSNWLGEWVGYYLLYKIGVALVAGLVLGWLLARILFSLPIESDLARAIEGLEATGMTLLVYGLTELAEGYGFLAVFVAALVVRHEERTHDYHRTLHAVAEKGEHLLMVLVMLLFGGALADGLLAPLTPLDAVVAVVLVFLVRPLAGFAGLVGYPRKRFEQGVVAFFGIRGIGSFYYLAYGLEQGDFPAHERLWAVVGCVVLISVVVHGLTAKPAVDRLPETE